jgi:hypothetical protein
MNISLNSALDIRYQLSSFRCGNKTKQKRLMYIDLHHIMKNILFPIGSNWSNICLRPALTGIPFLLKKCNNNSLCLQHCFEVFFLSNNFLTKISTLILGYYTDKIFFIIWCKSMYINLFCFVLLPQRNDESWYLISKDNFQSLRKQHSIINVSNNFHVFGQ